MTISGSAFDDKIQNWKREAELPWARLKYNLVQANLAKHLGQGPLRILEAGGGNGLDAIPLARQGHAIEVVDYSREMLADLQDGLEREGLRDRVTTHLADLGTIDSLFPAGQFDLVLCHNVLQYVEDVPALLGTFARLLRPGGMISILSINRFSSPYLTAFLDGDLDKAREELGGHAYQARIFNLEMKTWCAEDMVRVMEAAGFSIEADYGVRCICDYWGDNARKSDPQVFEKIERMEFALTALHPYKLLARYFQIIGRKA